MHVSFDLKYSVVEYCHVNVFGYNCRVILRDNKNDHCSEEHASKVAGRKRVYAEDVELLRRQIPRSPNGQSYRR